MKFLFNTRLLGLSIILFLAYNSQAQLIKEYKKYANIAYKQGDYKLAIQEGSTYIRVGSLLLGDREY